MLIGATKTFELFLPGRRRVLWKGPDGHTACQSYSTYYDGAPVLAWQEHGGPSALSTAWPVRGSRPRVASHGTGTGRPKAPRSSDPTEREPPRDGR